MLVQTSKDINTEFILRIQVDKMVFKRECVSSAQIVYLQIMYSILYV